MGLYQFLYLAIICFSFSLVSCSNKPNGNLGRENARDYAEQEDIKIRIPLNEFEHLSNNTDDGTAETRLDAEAYKFVVYIDSSVCTTCEFQTLGIWNSVIRHANQITDVDFFFILSPSKDNLEAIRCMYRFKRFLMDVYLDPEFKFEQGNPIVRKSMFHHFLLSPNDSIIYIGDPTADIEQKERLLQVLKDEIKK